MVVRTKDGQDGNPPEVMEVVIEGGDSYKIPEVGAMEEVGDGFQGDMSSAGIDEVDRMIEQLEENVTEDSVNEWKQKASMYKTMMKNLRAKVKELQEGNVKLVKENDLGKKRLSEYQSHSVAELGESLRPSLEPIVGLVAEVSSLRTLLGSMEERLGSCIKAGTCEVSGVVSKALDEGKSEVSILANKMESGIFERLGELSSSTVFKERVEKPSSPGPMVLDDASGEWVFMKKETSTVTEINIKEMISLDGAGGGMFNKSGSSGMGDGLREATGGERSGIEGDRNPQPVIVPSRSQGGGRGILPTPAEFQFIQQNYVATSRTLSMESGPGGVRRDWMTPGGSKDLSGDPEARQGGNAPAGVRKEVYVGNPIPTVHGGHAVPRNLMEDFSRPPPPITVRRTEGGRSMGEDQGNPVVKKKRWDVGGPL